MRTPLLLLALALTLPATADAQRRYNNRHHDDRGTDLQVLGQGLSVNGVGLRFWLTPRTALATRLNFDYTRADEADVTSFGLGVGLNVERHMDPEARVHSYFTAGGQVGVSSLSRDVGLREDNTSTQLHFGGEVGLGAEARLIEGLSLSGQYVLGVNVASREGNGGPVMGGNGAPSGPGDESVFNVHLGGVPRLALSFRF